MTAVLVASSIALWVLLLLNLGTTLSLIKKLSGNPGSSSGGPENYVLAAGNVCPDFSALQLDGSSTKRDDFAGVPFVLLFVGASCGPCRDILPTYLRLEEAAARSGVRPLIVSLDDMDQSRGLAADFDIKMPMLLVAPRTTNPLMKDFQIGGTPGFCFVGANGIIEASGHPSNREWRDLMNSWSTSKQLSFDRVARSLAASRE